MASRILSFTIRRLSERAVRSRRAWSEAAGFTAPSPAGLFLGSQPTSRSCSWKRSTIRKSDAKMNSIHLAALCTTSGLNDLPRLTEQAFGRTHICRAPLRWLNQESTPCRAAFITAPSTSTANEAGTCRKQHPVAACPPQRPWAPASPIPRVAERTRDTKAAAGCARTSGAGSFWSGTPWFLSTGTYSPSLHPLNMENQERENGGCFPSWQLSLNGAPCLYRRLMFTTAIHLFRNSVHLL